MIVYRLNPTYVLISDNIFYNTKKIVRLVNDPRDIKTYLRLSGEIIALIAYFFFLEFFEFNCYGLNFNTRSNIDKRSRIETIDISSGLADGRSDSFISYSSCSRIDLQNDDDNKQDNQEEMLKEGEKNN